MSSLWESWANKGGRFMTEGFVSNPALVGRVETLCSSQRPPLHPSFSFRQHPTQAMLLVPFLPWFEYHTGEQRIRLPEQPQEGWCSSLNLQKITSPAPNLQQREAEGERELRTSFHCCLWLLWGLSCTPRKKLFSIRWMSIALIFEATLSCVIQTKLELQTPFPQPLMGLQSIHHCTTVNTLLSPLQCVSATCRSHDRWSDSSHESCLSFFSGWPLPSLQNPKLMKLAKPLIYVSSPIPCIILTSVMTTLSSNSSSCWLILK